MPKAPTVKDAKMITLLAWRKYRAEPFKVAVNGPNHAALRMAERQGWVWFMLADRACVTVDGRRVLADYGVPQ